MYVPRGEEVTAQVRALAELRARPTAVLSGPAAARAWGHPWVADFVEDVIVITPGEHPGSTIPAGISIRRGALDDDIVHADIGGTPLRLAGPLDVTIDCVEKLSDPEAIAFLDGAIRAWDIESRLKEWAATNRGRGAKRMRELLQWVDWRAESRPESLLRTLLRRSGCTGWVPQFLVHVRGGSRSTAGPSTPNGTRNSRGDADARSTGRRHRRGGGWTVDVRWGRVP